MMSKNKDHWRIVRPLSTHFRESSCQEVNCEKFNKGWHTVLKINNKKEAHAIAYIRHSTMNFRERWVDLETIDIWFPPEQECFEGLMGNHKTNLERDPFFIKNDAFMEVNAWKDGIQERFYQLGRE